MRFWLTSRSPWSKALASLCTLSTGGAGGKEGPTANKEDFESDALIPCIISSVTTNFTVQLGGVIGPSLFIGGMLGGLGGTLSPRLFPEYVPSVAPYIVVEMASFFAGVSNASIAALVMVSELTGGYKLLPPLMIVSVNSLIFFQEMVDIQESDQE